MCIPWAGGIPWWDCRRPVEKVSELLTALNHGFLKLVLGHLLSQQSGGLVKIHRPAAHPDLLDQPGWVCRPGNPPFGKAPQVIPLPASQSPRSAS